MGCLLCLWPCNRLVPGHPLLLVYISLDQARIDRDRFAPNQPDRNAHRNDSLKDPTQGVTLPEAFVPRTTEYRVIGDPVLNAELAEPPVGQVDLDFSAQPALRAERKHIANDQHPDHQHRINRGPTRVRVIRRQFFVHPTQIEKTVDLPHQMIGRNHLVEIKQIEKLSLSFFPPPHHAPLPPMPSPPTESWFAIRIKGSFATQSPCKRTQVGHHRMSVSCQWATSQVFKMEPSVRAMSRGRGRPSDKVL